MGSAIENIYVKKYSIKLVSILFKAAQEKNAKKNPTRGIKCTERRRIYSIVIKKENNVNKESHSS